MLRLITVYARKTNSPVGTMASARNASVSLVFTLANTVRSRFSKKVFTR